MPLVEVLNKDLQQRIAVLLDELTGLVRDVRAEVAAVKAVREALRAALEQKG